MAYILIIKPKARKSLDKLDFRDRARVEHVLSALAGDPFSGKKLHGEMKEYYSIRVWPYRIMYEIRKRELVVLVVEIGRRQGIYH